MDMKVFFDSVRKSLFKGRMTAAQVSGCERIIAAHEQYGYGHDAALAYFLTTSYHETGQKMQPVRETYATSTAQAKSRLETAWKKGKLTWVKTPYWRNGWFGRGDVQLTHEANYSGKLRDEVLDLFKVDIHADPDAVLRPDVSAYIMIEGMTKGLTSKSDFTASALESFIKPGQKSGWDYENARKTVNPGEKSSYALLAGYAVKFEAAIRAARSAAGESFSIGTTRASPRPEPVDIPTDIYDGKFHPEVEAAQQLLNRKGWPEVGTIDGKWGTKSSGAVLSAKSYLALPTGDAKLTPEFLAALSLLPDNGRAVAPARANATVNDLRAKGAADVKAIDLQQYVNKGFVALGTVGTVSAAVDKLGEYSDLAQKVAATIDPLKAIVMDNIGLILLGGGAFGLVQAWKVLSIRLQKHQTAQDVSE